MRPLERHRVLDPETRLGEILFGLIMVLTFTGTLSVATAGREEVRTMLLGALGCNLAWGIVDGVMYLLDDLIVRNRALADLRRLQAARGAAEADAVLASTFPESVAGVLRPGDLDAVRERLLRLPLPPRARLTRASFAGAFAVFVLVVGSTFPPTLPFLFLRDPATALRVSNLVAVVMMFAAGCLAGRSTGVRPLWAGLWVAGIGLALVGITMLLGG